MGSEGQARGWRNTLWCQVELVLEIGGGLQHEELALVSKHKRQALAVGLNVKSNRRLVG